MNKIFLDLEANQFNSEHYILQLSAIKVDKDFNILEEFNMYCKPTTPIKNRILELINKNETFFLNIKESEFEVINSFIKFMNNDPIYVYGNYDKIVLKSSFKRNNISLKVKVIDIQEKYINNFFSKDFNLSLKRLCSILNIEANNNHDALNDAMLLKRVCESLYKKIISKDTFIKMLNQEKYRPIWKTCNNISNDNISKNYFLLWMSIDKINKENDNFYYRLFINEFHNDSFSKKYRWDFSNLYDVKLRKFIIKNISKKDVVFIFNGDSKIFYLLNELFKNENGYFYLKTKLACTKNNLEFLCKKIKMHYNELSRDFSNTIIGELDEIF